MIAIALALAAGAAPTCQIDRTLPAEFASWRYQRAKIDQDRALASFGNDGLALDFRDLPAPQGQATTRFFQTGQAGSYVVATDRDTPLTLFGDARGADGKRLAIAPVAVRGGPVCTSINTVRFYNLPAGNYYVRAEGLDERGARTFVRRLD